MYATLAGPMETQQINRDLYVGYGELTTIQQAVNTAIAIGAPYGLIHIPADYQGSDAISALVNGSANLYILDERNGNRQIYVWVTNAYVPAPFSQIAGIGAPQINHTLFVGTAKFPTIQGAINFAVQYEHFVVIITPTYTGNENIATLTGGDTTIYLSDQRTDQWQNYHWNGTQYVVSGISEPSGTFTTLTAQDAIFTGTATLQGSPVRTFANSPFGGSMQFPPAGVAVSTGAAWQTPSINPADLPRLSATNNTFAGQINAAFIQANGPTTGTAPGCCVLDDTPAGTARIISRNTAANAGILGTIQLIGASGDANTIGYYLNCTPSVASFGVPVGVNAALISSSAAPPGSCVLDDSPAGTGRMVSRNTSANAGILGSAKLTGVSGDGNTSRDYINCWDAGSGTSEILLNGEFSANAMQVTATRTTATAFVAGTAFMDIYSNSLRFVAKGFGGNTLGTISFNGFAADESKLVEYIHCSDTGGQHPQVTVNTPLTAAGTMTVHAVGANVFAVGQTVADNANPVQMTGSVYAPNTGGYGANGGTEFQSVHQGVQYTDFKINPGGGNVVLGGSGSTVYSAAPMVCQSTLGVTGNFSGNNGVFQTVGAIPPGSFTATGAGGLFVGWNFTNGSGETDYINCRGGGGGGHYWYNATSGVALGSGAWMMALIADGLHIPNGLFVTGAKNFQIVHPVDDTKLLTHSTVEGPECAVFYRGEAQTTGGMAEITLPDYFEALVMPGQRTVQVTAKVDWNGADFGALAATDVIAGKFRVFSQNSSQNFYWEVKAVRGDIPALEVVTDRPVQVMPADESSDPGEPATMKKNRKRVN